MVYKLILIGEGKNLTTPNTRIANWVLHYF
jgi:hypothetical protein